MQTKNKQGSIIGLIKFMEKKEYAEEFLKGNLYCNTVTYFKNCDKADIDIAYREDFFEGADFIINGNTDAKLIFKEGKDDEVKFPLNSDLGFKNLRIQYDKDYNYNIQCLYSLVIYETISRNNFRIDPKIFSLGSYVVLILNSKEFLRRVRRVLDDKVNYGLIDYVDIEDYSGTWNIFKKPKLYSHQNEFRIAYKTEENKPDILKIGDISDIAKLLTLEEFLNLEIGISDKDDPKKIFDKFKFKDLI